MRMHVVDIAAGEKKPHPGHTKERFLRLGDPLPEVEDRMRIGRRQKLKRFEMRHRDDLDMPLANGRMVQKRDASVVAMHDMRGSLARRDPAKQAVSFHTAHRTPRSPDRKTLAALSRSNVPCA